MLDTIPVEIILNILSFLNSFDINTMKLVSIHFNQIVSKYFLKVNYTDPLSQKKQLYINNKTNTMTIGLLKARFTYPFAPYKIPLRHNDTTFDNHEYVRALPIIQNALNFKHVSDAGNKICYINIDTE